MFDVVSIKKCVEVLNVVSMLYVEQMLYQFNSSTYVRCCFDFEGCSGVKMYIYSDNFTFVICCIAFDSLTGVRCCIDYESCTGVTLCFDFKLQNQNR